MQTLLVTDQPLPVPPEAGPDLEVVDARTYLVDPALSALRRAKVYNFCRSTRYQGIGYYVSLLAEARGHRPTPSLTTLQDLRNPSLVRSVVAELSEQLPKLLAAEKGTAVTIHCVFGRSLEGAYDPLAAQLFRALPTPLLRATFSKHPKSGDWSLQRVSAFALNELTFGEQQQVVARVAQFFSKPHIAAANKKEARFELAILVNPAEKEPPSDPKAIKRLVAAAESIGFAASLITRDDYRRLSEYDALFIRETTNVNHHTYRFARKAMAEGLVVIDDPVSILRCTNKVFLAEVMERNKLPTPETLIVHRDNVGEIPLKLGFPCVLKLPDGSFSAGVQKADNAQELAQRARAMFARTDLFIAQRFLPTSFDWRIGVFDRKALYACKYEMAASHWQIVLRDTAGEKVDAGNAVTLPVEQVPPRVLEAALKAANLVGDGLYGVDVKEIRGQPFVIEVNDNPSIDGGIEDEVLGDALYTTILLGMMRRIERLRGLERKS